jgi:hypothetical protein
MLADEIDERRLETKDRRRRSLVPEHLRLRTLSVGQVSQVAADHGIDVLRGRLEILHRSWAAF